MTHIIRRLNGELVNLLVTKEQCHTTEETVEIVYRVIDLNELQDCIDHASFGYKYLWVQTDSHSNVIKQLMSLSELREKCPWCNY